MRVFYLRNYNNATKKCGEPHFQALQKSTIGCRVKFVSESLNKFNYSVTSALA